MSALGSTEAMEDLAPPEVSRLVRVLCEPWMWCKRTYLRTKLSRVVTERVDALLAEARQMNIDITALLELIQERDDKMQAETAPER